MVNLGKPWSLHLRLMSSLFSPRVYVAALALHALLLTTSVLDIADGDALKKLVKSGLPLALFAAPLALSGLGHNRGGGHGHPHPLPPPPPPPPQIKIITVPQPVPVPVPVHHHHQSVIKHHHHKGRTKIVHVETPVVKKKKRPPPPPPPPPPIHKIIVEEHFDDLHGGHDGGSEVVHFSSLDDHHSRDFMGFKGGDEHYESFFAPHSNKIDFTPSSFGHGSAHAASSHSYAISPRYGHRALGAVGDIDEGGSTARLRAIRTAAIGLPVSRIGAHPVSVSNDNRANGSTRGAIGGKSRSRSSKSFSEPGMHGGIKLAQGGYEIARTDGGHTRPPIAVSPIVPFGFSKKPVRYVALQRAPGVTTTAAATTTASIGDQRLIAHPLINRYGYSAQPLQTPSASGLGYAAAADEGNQRRRAQQQFLEVTRKGVVSYLDHHRRNSAAEGYLPGWSQLGQLQPRQSEQKLQQQQQPEQNLAQEPARFGRQQPVVPLSPQRDQQPVQRTLVNRRLASAPVVTPASSLGAPAFGRRHQLLSHTDQRPPTHGSPSLPPPRKY